MAFEPEGGRPRAADAVCAWSLGLAAAIVVIAIFATLGGAGFLSYDDPLMVIENAMVQGGLSIDGIAYAFTDTTMNLWHPLTWLSHMLDWQLFGDWAGGHHLTSVLWHAANTALVFGLLFTLTERAGVSFMVALLFGLHPMQVESVAWISERKDVLSTFFYLLTALAYVRWARGGKRAWYAGAVALCLLGFLAKPSLMTLPFALLLLDFWPLGRVDLSGVKPALASVARLAWGKLPFFVLAGIFVAVAWKVESGGAHAGVAHVLTMGERVAVTGLAYGSYLARTFWPVGLAPFYAHPEVLSAELVAFCWSLLAVVSVAAICLVKRAPYVFFGWFWFVGLIFPASGIITISDNFAPDRYSYLAHVGLFVAVVWGFSDLFRLAANKLPSTVVGPLRRGAVAAACAALAVACFKQVGHWKNDESLWRHAVAVTERNYFAHNQLAVVLLESGREVEGLEQLEASVAAKADFAFSQANLGRVYARLGRVEEAKRAYRVALSIKGGNAVMRRELEALQELPVAGDRLAAAQEALARANAAYAAGDREQAVAQYALAAENAPGQLAIRGNLGAVLVELRRFEEAVPHLELAAAEPAGESAAKACFNLARAHRALGQRDLALHFYRRTLEHVPGQAEVSAELTAYEQHADPSTDGRPS